MLADDPAVVGNIVAEHRLTPVVHGSERTIFGTVRIVCEEFFDVVRTFGVGGFRRYDIVVVGAFVVAMAPVPQEIEDGNLFLLVLVGILVAGIVRVDGVALPVDRYPGERVDLLVDRIDRSGVLFLFRSAGLAFVIIFLAGRKKCHRQGE